ncbi:hypothetical protein QQF64_011196 [Cirrhinus molitorella]|uniref:Uncharacterized protein n=1 Tax=Cirrhinus molitorella TaxID=172907 RepID=A0ABR3M269_9TELE
MHISAANKTKTPVGIIDRSLEEDVSVTLRLDLTSGSLGSGTPLDVAKQPGTELHIQVLDSGRGKQDKGLKRGGLNERTMWGCLSIIMVHDAMARTDDWDGITLAKCRILLCSS